jgi:hypothetical protein
MTYVAVVVKAQLALGKTLHDMMHDRLTKQACTLAMRRLSVRLSGSITSLNAYLRELRFLLSAAGGC